MTVAEREELLSYLLYSGSYFIEVEYVLFLGIDKAILYEYIGDFVVSNSNYYVLGGDFSQITIAGNKVLDVSFLFPVFYGDMGVSSLGYDFFYGNNQNGVTFSYVQGCGASEDCESIYLVYNGLYSNYGITQKNGYYKDDNGNDIRYPAEAYVSNDCSWDYLSSGDRNSMRDLIQNEFNSSDKIFPPCYPHSIESALDYMFSYVSNVNKKCCLLYW